MRFYIILLFVFTVLVYNESNKQNDYKRSYELLIKDYNKLIVENENLQYNFNSCKLLLKGN